MQKISRGSMPQADLPRSKKSVSIYSRSAPGFTWQSGLPLRCLSDPLIIFFLFYLYLYILGSIPLDPSLAQSLEEGKSFMDLFPNSPTLSALSEITNKLLEMDKSVNT